MAGARTSLDGSEVCSRPGCPTLLGWIDVRERGFLQPLLIGGLEHASVCLQQSVLERQADLGPGKQSLAAFQAAELVQEPVQQLGGALGRQHTGTGSERPQAAFLSARAGSQARGPLELPSGIRRIQIIFPGNSNQGEQGTAAGTGERRPHPVRRLDLLGGADRKV